MKNKLIGLFVLIILSIGAIVYAIEVEEISVLTIREVMIPMPDGIQLAADLYMPADIPAVSIYQCCLNILLIEKMIPVAQNTGCIPTS